jgi:iron complex transport system substrate-binding protein
LLRRIAITAGALAVLALPALADTPPRVMSLNVCTDQLAMLLAAPDQLVSVSEIAADPSLSFHHAMAAGYKKNRGLAEEVFLARPDVVVTGTFSLHNTTALLRHLGFKVEEFDFAQTLNTIPAEIRRTVLGQEERADAMAAAFEAELTTANPACGPAPTIIAYGQNGVALGSGT